MVFSLSAAIADQNKTVIYNLLFKASAARIGITSVLHTWGSALTHHPHVHMIVPGGGISPDGARWVSCRPGFFLPVRVLSRLYRRLLLEKLIATHKAGRLYFFGNQRHLPMRKPSRLTSHRCATPNGWSMPSVRSAVPRPCWPICRAIHTASPTPTAA